MEEHFSIASSNNYYEDNIQQDVGEGTFSSNEWLDKLMKDPVYNDKIFYCDYSQAQPLIEVQFGLNSDPAVIFHEGGSKLKDGLNTSPKYNRSDFVSNSFPQFIDELPTSGNRFFTVDKTIIDNIPRIYKMQNYIDDSEFWGNNQLLTLDGKEFEIIVGEDIENKTMRLSDKYYSYLLKDELVMPPCQFISYDNRVISIFLKEKTDTTTDDAGAVHCFLAGQLVAQKYYDTSIGLPANRFTARVECHLVNDNEKPLLLNCAPEVALRRTLISYCHALDKDKVATFETVHISIAADDEKTFPQNWLGTEVALKAKDMGVIKKCNSFEKWLKKDVPCRQRLALIPIFEGDKTDQIIEATIEQYGQEQKTDMWRTGIYGKLPKNGYVVFKLK